MAILDEYEQTIESWRNEYISDRNAKKGWEILERLAKIQSENSQQSEQNGEFDDFSTSKLITMIMSDIDPKELLVDHQMMFLEFVPSAHPNILRHVVRLIHARPDAVEMLKTSALAIGIAIARRVTERGAISEEIASLLAELVDHSLIGDELRAQLETADSEAKSRIFTIAAFRAKTHKSSECIGWLYEAILATVCDSRDLLAQLDALDTFVDVALSGETAARALNDAGIVEKIYAQMEVSRESPDMGDFYFYGTRFLCYMARSFPDVINSFPDFVRRIMVEIRMFDQLSVVARLGAFDHFASLCFSLEAKNALESIFKDSKELENTLAATGAACAMGTMEMKSRTIQAVTLLFQNCTPEMAVEWYERLGGKAMTNVSIANIKKPFPEMKAVLYELWTQLLRYPPLVRQFLDYQGFIDWMLDERSESLAEFEPRKRELIRRVLELAESSSELGVSAELVARLRAYLVPAPAPAPQIQEMAL